MKHLHFTVHIKAPVSKVWTTMLSPETYRLWTGAFCEGSYFEGSWEQGASIKFLGPSGGRMLAEIAENRLHEFLSIRHLGEIGADQPKLTEPFYENYTFQSVNGGTTLDVNMDSLEQYEAMFQEMWPRALNLLKNLCESGRP